ncbi:MAG: hypothetical protein KDD25_08430 [Bdellovibrionales bacterium]|nr:hypothetical protein [Bdellovibrionales bacterium]
MSWIANLIKLTLLLALSFAGLTFFAWLDHSPIFFESLESKTVKGDPVFNRIQLQTDNGKDVWLMEQSHIGPNPQNLDWDKIAIVVKENRNGGAAEFLQLMPGDEPISLGLKSIGLKASCFMCHSNGPRAIRPNYNSNAVRVSVWNKIRITIWNLKIKSYGPMRSHAIDSSRKPFRYEHSGANQVLTVTSCTKCHNSQSRFGRGELTKQNFQSIRFMVENNFMPPLGFSLPVSDRKKLMEFAEL